MQMVFLLQDTDFLTVKNVFYLLKVTIFDHYVFLSSLQNTFLYNVSLFQL